MTEQRCKGTTKAGTRCARRVKDGRRFCYQHRPANIPRPLIDQDTLDVIRRRAADTQASLLALRRSPMLLEVARTMQLLSAARDQSRASLLELNMIVMAQMPDLSATRRSLNRLAESLATVPQPDLSWLREFQRGAGSRALGQGGGLDWMKQCKALLVEQLPAEAVTAADQYADALLAEHGNDDAAVVRAVEHDLAAAAGQVASLPADAGAEATSATVSAPLATTLDARGIAVLGCLMTFAMMCAQMSDVPLVRNTVTTMNVFTGWYGVLQQYLAALLRGLPRQGNEPKAIDPPS